MKKWIAIVCLALLCLSTLTGCFCSHENQTQADCENPKICPDCSEIEGEPLGHDWQAATYDVAKTCSRCGKTDGEPLNILDSYPANVSRSEGAKFLFTAEDFVPLLNHELQATSYRVELVQEADGQASYRFLKNGEEDPDIVCNVTFDGGYTEGKAMYLFVHLNTGHFPSSEDSAAYEAIMGAAFRAVHISQDGTTYDTLLQSSGVQSEEKESFSGIIDNVGYSVSFIDEQINFMILLDPAAVA